MVMVGTPYILTTRNSAYLHGRPAFGPSCTEFVLPGCWLFENGETSLIDDVFNEHAWWTTPLYRPSEIFVYGQVTL